MPLEYGSEIQHSLIMIANEVLLISLIVWRVRYRKIERIQAEIPFYSS